MGSGQRLSFGGAREQCWKREEGREEGVVGSGGPEKELQHVVCGDLVVKLKTHVLVLNWQSDPWRTERPPQQVLIG